MIKKSAFLIVMLALSSAATGDAARFRAAAAAEKNGLSLGPLTIRKGDRNPKKSSSNNRSKKDAASSSSNSDELAGGQASIAAMIFNLVNNVAGAGILALSAGQKGTGYFPAIIISTVLGTISARTFCMVGEACDMLGEADFKGLWAKTIGEKTTWVVDSSIAILCMAVSVIYSGVIGDVFTPLLDMAGFPAAWNDRQTNILAITGAFLLPMSLIRNLSALAFTSILGFCAISYTVLFIIYRALDGSYKLGSGKFVTDGVLRVLPAFEKTSLWNINFSSLVLASNLGLAYVAHYNSPSMYRELKDTSASRYATMVTIGYTLLIILYVVTMVAGYSTFGDNTYGNILLNYHPKDVLSILGQLATGFSILFGFPLVAAGARESIIGAAKSLGFPQLGDPKNHAKLVVAMLTLVTAISINVKDISLVMGLTGAALGSFNCYVCPAMVYVKAVEIHNGKNSPEYKAAALSKVLIPFGFFIGGLGIYITIRSAMQA